MERHEVLEMMAALKLAGMRAAFNELLTDGLKRQYPVQRIIGELLKAEIADKQARSIKYQMSVAKLPLAKELADFDFTDTPVNEPLVRELAAGGFLAHQRNAVLIACQAVQFEPCEPQVPLHIAEQRLDLLAFASRLEIGRGAPERASVIARFLVDVTLDPSRR